ncbi:hypothetical protein [Rhizobium sp. SL86]|uniref:hypothetical protein n=1 Tax=Rhizobium sp. SL86 TaxID=2995148 RepID=UPI0022769E60|nr:hypothetical protein [Rhizobium sp. SL86]MCY1667899.1 hypothetical protein [Rhizobium sp. SL86]
MDRMTREEMMEARMNGLERRIEQLESWTGADEDGNWRGEEASVTDRMFAQELLIMQLLRNLEAVSPHFSVKRLREETHALAVLIHDELNPNSDLPADELERSRRKMIRVIDDLLPVSRHDAQEVESTKVHLTLVPEGASGEPGDPA